MKKVIGACIERLLEFDAAEEVNQYLKKLELRGKRYEVQNRCKMKNGKFRIRVKEQYNSNEMI